MESRGGWRALRPFTQDMIMLELVSVLIEMWDVCRKEAMRMGNKRWRAELCISAKYNVVEIEILHEQLILYI